MRGIDPHLAHSFLLRARRGDDRAWSGLVEMYGNLVYSVARSARLQSEDAEEVFQHTFLALYKNLEKIDDGHRIGKWLTVTASRESIRISRLSSKTRNVGEDNELLEEVIQADVDAADELVAIGAQHETAIESLSQLKPICKDLLLALFDEKPLSYDEISSTLGIAPGSIGPTRSRCIEKLRSVLIKKGFFEGEDVSGLSRRALRELHNAQSSK